jgi:hypothetical protein
MSAEEDYSHLHIPQISSTLSPKAPTSTHPNPIKGITFKLAKDGSTTSSNGQSTVPTNTVLNTVESLN